MNKKKKETTRKQDKSETSQPVEPNVRFATVASLPLGPEFSGLAPGTFLSANFDPVYNRPR
jgi:hypothetical protein